MKLDDWKEKWNQQRREELQKSSALNRLGQGNSGGVKRSPVRHEPARSMNQTPNKPWPKPTRW